MNEPTLKIIESKVEFLNKFGLYIPIHDPMYHVLAQDKNYDKSYIYHDTFDDNKIQYRQTEHFFSCFLYCPNWFLMDSTASYFQYDYLLAKLIRSIEFENTSSVIRFLGDFIKIHQYFEIRPIVLLSRVSHIVSLVDLILETYKKKN